MSDMLTILRVYNNGDRVKQTLPEARAIAEIDYSKIYRWGCALFIGSECVQLGYLGQVRCDAISEELKRGETPPATQQPEHEDGN